ncbi:DUF1858 domain-containing protein [Azospirillum sp. TSO35-2]|uniref:DUF1858 domain-containing protein n=1 Tax=Azospirillum sp. TSO35-2 TaxID=716796 RepID=UPI000D608D99|nr:DUF1858 domain-containing protein [Azospirillum sp. TSO35-2]PWC35898.1 hypothetical protein TSO352_11795 [Azospirillum sp. TSO35-2]
MDADHRRRPPQPDTNLADLTMADLMRLRPACVPVLLRRGLACPGCAMAPFMTVREAADAYGLDLDAFLSDLAATPAPHTPTESRECTPTA